MTKTKEALEMYRHLRKIGWSVGAAVAQIELWKDGVRDVRIADDTFSAYETVRYGE